MGGTLEAVTVASALMLGGAAAFAAARAGTLLWSVNAFSKFVTSFLKTEWRLVDYPVHLLRLPPDLPSPGNPLGETWMAYVENGALAGFGPSPEAARQDLTLAFKIYASASELPRPGLRWRGPAANADFEGADPQVFL